MDGWTDDILLLSISLSLGPELPPSPTKYLMQIALVTLKYKHLTKKKKSLKLCFY